MAMAVRSPTQAGRLVALCIRPVVIFFGLTGLGYRLLTSPGQNDRPAGVGEPLTGYLDWLRGVFPLREELQEAVGESAQIMVAGCVVGAVLGVVLGMAMRSKRFGALAAGLNPVLLAASGPVASLTVAYWLGLRLHVFAPPPAGLLDDPAGTLEYLVVPALVIGLMVAPGLAALMAAVGPYHEPPGLLAAASTLASRSESREGWRFGLPAGSLVAGLMSAEIIWNRGVTSLFFDSLFSSDLRVTLDVVALLALGGAGLALVVDVLGLRDAQPITATKAGLRLADGSTSPRPGVALWIGGALTTLWLALAASGLLVGDVVPDLESAGAGLFSNGHLLGADRLGTDLLSAARAGLRVTPLIALVPALGAVALATCLVVVQRRLGALGEVFPGAIIDGLWWPQPVLVAIAAHVALSDGEAPLRLSTLVLMALGLTPGATRLLRREQVGVGLGGLVRAAGIGLFLAAHSLLAYFIVDYRRGWFDSFASAGLARRLDDAGIGLDGRLLPSLVFGLAMMLALGALYTLGAGLIRLGWQFSAATALAELEEDDETLLIAPTGLGPLEQPLRPGGLLETGTPSSFLLPSDEHAATLTDTPVIDLEDPPTQW